MKNQKMLTQKIYRAKWVMVDPETWISNGYIEISPSGIIHASGVYQSKQTSDVTDLGDGILMPALINAHTHLELSALLNRVPMHMGFTTWVDQLITERMLTGPERLKLAAAKACRTLWETGTCAVGEISSLNLTQDILSQSGLSGVWFREYLGNEPIEIPENTIFPDRLCLSLAGHAPHTSSPKLLRLLKQDSQGKPFSIHVAESDDEMEFITRASGPWAEFLISRDVQYSEWGLPQQSPVKHLNNIGILDKNTLVVHLLNCDDSDLNILRECQCHVCICPRSNLNLHNRLPDCERMLQKGLNVCLGTDSLASVDSLSLWDEMAFLFQNDSGLSPKTILSMATASGAQALGFSHQLGRLAPGYNACLLYVPIHSNTIDQAVHQLVAGDFSQDNRVISASY